MAGKVGVKLQINEAELKAQIKKQRSMLRMMGSNSDVAKAQAAALNKGADKIRTKVVRGVSQTLKVKQQLLRGNAAKKIKPKIKVSGAKPDKLNALVTGHTGGISLMRLNPRQTKSGVKAGSHFVEGAFLASATRKPKGSTKGRGILPGPLLGIEQVFTRKGRSRYKLKRQVVTTRPEITRQMKLHAESVVRHDMARLLLHEYNWRIKKKLGQ